MLLPNFQWLRLDNKNDDDDCGGKIVSIGAHTPDLDPNSAPSKRAKLSAEPLVTKQSPNIDQINDKFKAGTRFSMGSDLDKMRGLSHFIATTRQESNWFFSSNGPNVKVQAIRTDSTTTTLGSRRADPQAVIDILQRKFANKPADLNYKKGCGTYNCFFSKVETNGMERWQVVLRDLLIGLNSSSNTKFTVPATVAIRAPKKKEKKWDTKFHTATPRHPNRPDSDWDAEGTRQEREELVLTLYAAHIGITPPIFATFPVEVIHEKTNKAVNSSYGYVVEDGWEDFGELLEALPNRVPSKDLSWVGRLIEKELMRLLKLVASYGLLQFDIKSNNLVARQVKYTSEYELRMIDFSPLFTAQVDFWTKPDDQTVSDSCVYFINGLLFLNQILRYKPEKLPMFRNLAKELVVTWKLFETTGQSKTLCGILAKDLKLKKYHVHLRNLHEAPDEGTYDQELQDAFWYLLNAYGKEESLKATDLHKPLDASYLGRLAEIIENEATTQSV